MIFLKGEDVVVQIAPFEYRKERDECQDKHRQSHDICNAIERLMEANGKATLKEISVESKQPLWRVAEHVDHYAKNPSKGPKLRVEKLVAIKGA